MSLLNMIRVIYQSLFKCLIRVSLYHSFAAKKGNRYYQLQMFNLKVETSLIL